METYLLKPLWENLKLELGMPIDLVAHGWFALLDVNNKFEYQVYPTIHQYYVFI